VSNFGDGRISQTINQHEAARKLAGLMLVYSSTLEVEMTSSSETSDSLSANYTSLHPGAESYFLEYRTLQISYSSNIHCLNNVYILF
jgi:hypothetical protein